MAFKCIQVKNGILQITHYFLLRLNWSYCLAAYTDYYIEGMALALEKLHDNISTTLLFHSNIEFSSGRFSDNVKFIRKVVNIYVNSTEDECNSFIMCNFKTATFNKFYF